MITLKINRRAHFKNQFVSADGEMLNIIVGENIEQFDLSKLTEGDYNISDCLILPYNPIQNIKVDESGNKIVQIFLDNPHERGIDAGFERSGISFTGKTIVELSKEEALKNIAEAFEEELKNGKFTSVILGVDVDCRRSEVKNDKQNVEGLISYMTRNDITTTDYKAYSEIVTGVTILKLETLVAEMEDYVLDLYQKKWALEQQIENGTTLTEVKQINW